MHFGIVLDLSDIDLLNIDLLDTHLDLLDTDIPNKQFLCLQDMSSGRLEDFCSITIFRLQRRLGDVC